MFSMFFTQTPRVKNATDAKTCDTDRFAKYFNEMLENHVYLAPSQFEAGFMSLAHTNEDIWKTLEAMETALNKL